MALIQNEAIGGACAVAIIELRYGKSDVSASAIFRVRVESSAGSADIRGTILRGAFDFGRT